MTVKMNNDAKFRFGDDGELVQSGEEEIGYGESELSEKIKPLADIYDPPPLFGRNNWGLLLWGVLIGGFMILLMIYHSNQQLEITYTSTACEDFNLDANERFVFRNMSGQNILFILDLDTGEACRFAR